MSADAPDPPGADKPVRGVLRRVANRLASAERLPIPPTERLTATERASAALALAGGLDRGTP
jgi:hypothetical protein